MLWVTEYLAYLGLRLSSVLGMYQAALLDGSVLDALTFQRDGLTPTEIDIRQGRMPQALMVALVAILLGKLADLSLQSAGQEVIL